MSLRVGVLPESWARWDAQLDRWQGVTVFSLSIYLRHMGEIDILTVEDGRGPVAAFPVPVLAKNGARTIARPTYVSPYFPILFRPDDGPPTRAERRRRAAVDALLDDIKRRYAGIVLPLHPNVTDMVPFQRAGVELELRTTYKLPLASLDALWTSFDPVVRNHVRKADGVTIEEEPSLEAFDFEAAVFYEDMEARAQWRALAHDLAAAGHGTALIARLDGRSVGGLFLAYDRTTAYNLLSYFDRRAPLRGIPSALIWAAAKTASNRALTELDLEGSVLPNVESFYQQFGGIRSSYFQVRWHA